MPFKMNDDSCALASILTWGLLKNQCFFLLVSVTLENKIKIPRFGSALVPACAATFFFPREMGIRKDRLGCGKQHQDLMFSWSSELPLQSTNTKLTTSRLVYEKCSLHFIPRLLKKKKWLSYMTVAFLRAQTSKRMELLVNQVSQALLLSFV